MIDLLFFALFYKLFVQSVAYVFPYFVLDSYEKSIYYSGMKTFELIAPCHFGLEAVLKKEILDLGYDIMLEQPVSEEPDELRALVSKARRLNKKIMVCHVLRYSSMVVAPII